MPTEQKSLRAALSASAAFQDRFLATSGATIKLRDLAQESCLDTRASGLHGGSVLLATADQFETALALIELDGVARQLVLCPPDLAAEHFPFVIDTVPVNAIVSDRSDLVAQYASTKPIVTPRREIAPAGWDRTPRFRTEWILLTSGTTGRPKMVVHDLATLAGGIDPGGSLAGSRIWSTFYDIRRYGGLQIFLRAVLTGGSLVLSNPSESPEEFLARAAGLGVTHISGTPSHWRKALMSQAARTINPEYVRLSGEIADQAILDDLRSVYPRAKISHAFASTEAGLAFDVNDGLAGFPAALIERGSGDVQMKTDDGSLCIRSPRTAIRYLGRGNPRVSDEAGFVDTGDVLELRGNRYYFVGRRDGVINVGGLKVHPEEIEAVVNRHPRVRVSLVRRKKNPITGAVVVADVALWTPVENGQAALLQQEILDLCREALPPYKVPAAITFLKDLPVAMAGKLVRPRA